MSEKKYNCDLVQDLLPLYQDNICSETSKRIVEEHLEDCGSCRQVAERLADTKIDQYLAEEKESVLKVHAKKEKRNAAKIGGITAGVLLIPIIVCLICNLAIGHGLSWFFIVLASMLVVASLTVVPMVVYEKKFFYTILSFTGALLLLLLTCCLYVKGDWFFLASIPTILGLSVFLMPYIIAQLPFEKGNAFAQRLGRHKGVLSMLWDTLWLYATIVVCGFHSADDGYWSVALSVTTLCVIAAWIIFALIRYDKSHLLTKSGKIVVFLGIFTLFANDIIYFLIEGQLDFRLTHMDFKTWHYTEAMGEASLAAQNANINCTVAFVIIIAGIILYAAGKLRESRRQKNES